MYIEQEFLFLTSIALWRRGFWFRFMEDFGEEEKVFMGIEAGSMEMFVYLFRKRLLMKECLVAVYMRNDLNKVRFIFSCLSRILILFDRGLASGIDLARLKV